MAGTYIPTSATAPTHRQVCQTENGSGLSIESGTALVMGRKVTLNVKGVVRDQKEGGGISDPAAPRPGIRDHEPCGRVLRDQDVSVLWDHGPTIFHAFRINDQKFC